MYGIMRIEKRKVKDTYGIEKENNRQANNPIELPASDIDWARTEQNYFFIKAENFKKTIDEELKKNGIDKYRKDAVLFLDGLYTASPEFFENKSKEDIVKYFSDCLKFHEKNYGQVFNAVIHFDESNPHLHVQSIPLVNVEDKVKLSAKELMGNQKKYHQMQNKFYEEVSSQYGLDRGEIKDSEHQREHLTTLQYKVKCQEEEKEKLKKENQLLKEELINKSKEITTLKDYIDLLKSKIEYIKEWLKAEKNIDDDLEMQIQRRRERERSR